jgi:hypothetical protein
VGSFGDASANHNVTTGTVNTARLCAHQRLPLPLLFVCEDNGLGISVRTPAGWIESAYGSRPHLRYESVDGTDPEAVLAVTAELGDWVRTRRRPAFLHLRTVRFGGHAVPTPRPRTAPRQNPRRPCRDDLIPPGACAPGNPLGAERHDDPPVYDTAPRSPKPQLASAEVVIRRAAPQPWPRRCAPPRPPSRALTVSDQRHPRRPAARPPEPAGVR